MRPARARILAHMDCRRGFTLLELLLVLLIVGTMASLAVPRFGRARDRLAVRGAALELAAALAVTRASAIRAGGASLHVDVAAGTAWITTSSGARLPDEYPLAARYGVRLESDRAGPIQLRYDPLGIGRIASAVIRVRRGGAVHAVTVSAYGRVRL